VKLEKGKEGCGWEEEGRQPVRVRNRDHEVRSSSSGRRFYTNHHHLPALWFSYHSSLIRSHLLSYQKLLPKPSASLASPKLACRPTSPFSRHSSHFPSNHHVLLFFFHDQSCLRAAYQEDLHQRRNLPFLHETRGQGKSSPSSPLVSRLPSSTLTSAPPLLSSFFSPDSIRLQHPFSQADLSSEDHLLS